MPQTHVYQCPLEDLEAEDQVSIGGLNRWLEVAGVTVDGDEVELTLRVRYRKGQLVATLPGHAHNTRIQAVRIARMMEQVRADGERGLPDRIDLSGLTVWPGVEFVYCLERATDKWVIAKADTGEIVSRRSKLDDRDADLARLGGARQEVFLNRARNTTEASA